jgi:hypothetical protein
LQSESVGRPHARVPADVDAALERARCRLAEATGLLLRVTWDGPAAAAGDVPDWLRLEAPQRSLLRVFARVLLLEAPFEPSLDVVLGADTHVKFSDAAVALGLSYAPYTSPHYAQPVAAVLASGGNAGGSSIDAPCTLAGTDTPPTLLKLVAGSWLCRSLLADPRIANDAPVLATSMLLDAMRTFGGTMKGRPFELLCIDAMCTRSFVQPDAPVGKLLPHLAVSAVRDAQVPRLTVVAMPKVTSATSKLGAAARVSLELERSRWPGNRPTLHPVDLQWFLTSWLRTGTLAVPSDAMGGTQDWFVRLGNDIVGAANKAAGQKNGTAWNDLQEELAKAPTLPAPFRYTLVLWSLNLAPQLRNAVGSAEACAFGSGSWFLRDGRLVQTAPTPASRVEEARFCVPQGVELVIVNPHAPSGGGLADLLGLDVLTSLRTVAAAGSSSEPLGVSSLLGWIKS